MILTGNEIAKRVNNKEIIVSPFLKENLNPNSYNFRLGRTMKVYKNELIDPAKENPVDIISIDDDGFILEPRKLYLAETIETMGSTKFVPTYAARSSVARMGMFINLSAPLGDIGFIGKWTIQLFCIHPVKVYYGMNIGQMMFWHTSGEITLYQGKYQNANGPIESRIHIDFHNNIEPSLQEQENLTNCSELKELPGKYKYIAQLSEFHPVPQLELVTETHLKDLISNFIEVKETLTEIEQHISITSGAFLTEDLHKMQRQMTTLVWSDTATKLLSGYMARFLENDGKFHVAVRSACQVEDLKEHSFAGIYETVLNVSSIDELKSALIKVWCSFYSVRAVIEKLSAKVIGQSHGMNIIVQKMLEPEISGVAFSCDPVTGHEELYIEYVHGLGEGFVSGEKESGRITQNSQDHILRAVHAQLRSIIASAKEALQTHVDIEWAYQDGKVWLLQARPVTNIKSDSVSSQPSFKYYELYSDLPDSLMKKLPQYAVYFNKKRKPLHDIAKQIGAEQVGSVILELNQLALDSPAVCDEIMRLFSCEQQVIDFSKAVRQLVVDKSELLQHLSSFMTDPNRIHFIVIRDFIKGQYGVITREIKTSEGMALVAEISEDGLLAMNRGSAVSQILNLGDHRAGEVFKGVNLSVLYEVTAKAIHVLGDIQIEWVFYDGHFYALDYSIVTDSNVFLSDSGRVMSQGYARGQVFVMQSNAKLESFSIAPSMSLTEIPDAEVYGELFKSLIKEIESLSAPPILFSKRPYAALASLLPYVAGFVFEKGPLLCHLGVLLREKQLPAICDEVLFHQMEHGEVFELDNVLTY